MNKLSSDNESLKIDNLASYTDSEFAKARILRDRIRNSRNQKWYITDSYFLDRLSEWISKDEFLASFIKDFDIDYITRQDFSADLVFKSTKLIKENKDVYLKEVCPRLASLLNWLVVDWNKAFELVEQKWIYVNAKLSSSLLFWSLWQILDLSNRYWENWSWIGKDIVLDYSSPNAAKRLHAWHIRSTILGHVIGNLYDANGYTCHRINFLNDWGWVGYLIEWLRRWEVLFSHFEIKNDMLWEIYLTFRKWQKYAESDVEFEWIWTEIELMKSCFWEFNDFNSFKANLNADATVDQSRTDTAAK